MNIVKVVIVIFCLGIGACSTTGTFTGRITNTEGEPEAGVTVQFWQNKWMPLHLPERVAETKTSSDGRYETVVKEHVSFIVIKNDAVNYSKSVKPKGKGGKYRNDVQVPKI